MQIPCAFASFIQTYFHINFLRNLNPRYNVGHDVIKRSLLKFTYWNKFNICKKKVNISWVSSCVIRVKPSLPVWGGVEGWGWGCELYRTQKGFITQVIPSTFKFVYSIFIVNIYKLFIYTFPTHHVPVYC